MRPLTSEEKAKLDEMTDAFPAVLEDVDPLIRELVQALKLPADTDPVWGIGDQIISGVDGLLRSPDYDGLSHDEQGWFHVRITFFVGEWLVRRYRGYWYLQADPQSSFFLSYVVGQFEGDASASVFFDPGQIALNARQSRSLSAEMREVCKLLANRKLFPVPERPKT